MATENNPIPDFVPEGKGGLDLPSSQPTTEGLNEREMAIVSQSPTSTEDYFGATQDLASALELTTKSNREDSQRAAKAASEGLLINPDEKEQLTQYEQNKRGIDIINHLQSRNADGTLQYPIIHKYLSDPAKAGQWLGQESVKRLSDLEMTAKQAEQSGENPLQQVGRALFANLGVGLAQNLAGTADLASKLLIGMEANSAEKNDTAMDWLLSFQKNTEELSQELKRERETISPIAEYKNPLQAPLTAAANLTAEGIKFAANPVSYFSSFYNDILNEGEKEGRNVYSSIANATLQSALMATAGHIMTGGTAQEMRNLLAQPNGVNKILGLLKIGYTSSAELEGIGLAQQGVNQATSNEPGKIDFSKSGDFLAQHVASFIVNGLTLSIGHGVPALVTDHNTQRVMNHLEDLGKAQKYQAINERMESLKEEVHANPDERAIAAKEILEKSGIEDNATMNGGDILFQARKNAGGDEAKRQQLVNDFANTLNIDPQKIQEGRTVNVPWSKLATQSSGNPVIDALAKDGKITYSDLEQNHQELIKKSEELQKQVQEMQEKDPRIQALAKEELTKEWQGAHKQLIKAGQSESRARIQVATMRSMLQGFAQRYHGLGEKEFLEKNPLEFRFDKKGGLIAEGQKNLVEKAIDKLKQDERGAFNFDTEGKGIVTLFKNADGSTALHEFSHFLTKKLEQAVEAKLGQGTATSDLNKLREFVGAREGEKLTNEQHEKIAGAFERWLVEGKAPSKGLMGAFNRIKQWMLDIYGTASQVGVEINNEVRGVFNRMSATDADIAQAEAYYGKQKEQASKMTKDADGKERVEEAAAQATQSAISKRAKKLTDLYLSLNKNRELILDKAKDDLQAQSDVYGALKSIREEGGIDRQSFVERFGDAMTDKINEAHGKSVIRENGKLDWSDPTLASHNANLEELFGRMGSSSSLQESAKALANRRTLEIAMGMDKVMRKDALDDLNTPEGLKYLEATAEELRKSIQEAQTKENPDSIKEGLKRPEITREELKLMRGIASDRVADMPINEAINVRSHHQEFARLGEDFNEALRKGDKERALQVRLEQIQQHYVIGESIKARTDARIALRALGPSKINSALDKSTYEYKNAIGYAFQAIGETKYRGINQEWMQAVKDSHAANVEKYLSDTNPELYDNLPKFIWSGTKEGIKDLTFGELMNLKDGIKNSIKLGRDSWELGKEGTANSIQKDVVNYAREMTQIPDFDPGAQGSFKRWSGVQWRQNQNFSTLIQMQADLFDGLQFLKTGKTGTLGSIVRMVIDGGQNSVKDINFINKELTPTYQVYEAARKRIDKEVKSYLDYGQDHVPGDLWNKGWRWTAERFMGVLSESGNESSYKRLLSMGFSEADIHWAVGHLNSAEIKSMDNFFNTLENYKPKLWGTYKKNYEDYPKSVEGRPITFKGSDGKEVTIKGGYFPLYFDREMQRQLRPETEGQIKSEAEIQAEKNQDDHATIFTHPEDMAARINDQSRASVRGGMLESRAEVPSSLPINLDFSQVFNRHIEAATRYANMSSEINYARGLINNPDFVRVFNSKWGHERYTNIKEWLDDAANPKRRSIDDNVLQKLIDLTKRSMLAFHPVSQTVNWTASQVKAIPYLANGDWVKGGQYFLQGYGVDNPRVLEKVMQEAGLPVLEGKTVSQAILEDPAGVELVNRLNHKAQLAKNLGDRIAANRNNLTIDLGNGRILSAKDVGNIGTQMMMIPDMMVTMPAVKMGYFAYLGEHAAADRDKGLSDKEIHSNAVKFGIGVLDRTNPVGLREDNSGMMRNPNKVISMLTMFKLWDSLMAGKLMTYSEAANRGIITPQQYASHIAADVMLEPVMQAALHTFIWGKGATIGAFALKAAGAVLGTSISGLGGGFSLLGSATQFAVGSNKYGLPAIKQDEWEKMASLPWLQKPIRATAAPIKDIVDLAKHPENVKEQRQIWADTGNAIAFWSGIPAQNFWNDFSRLAETATRWVQPQPGDEDIFMQAAQTGANQLTEPSTTGPARPMPTETYNPYTHTPGNSGISVPKP